jgi:CheY-like chemotaxis protein
MLSIALETYGFTTRVAHDGLEALRVAEDYLPEVAVLDIGLPVMDGYEVARRLKARFPNLPLIALTGYGQIEDARRARAAGFDEHLVKPVDIDRLHATLRRLHVRDLQRASA